MCINFNKISSNLIKVLGVFPLFFFRSSHRCAGCARVCVCEWNVFFVFSLFEIPFNFWLNNLQIHTYRSWCAFSSIIDTATEQISIHMRMQIATIPPKGPTLPFPVARIPLWACVHYQFMTKEWEKTSFYQKKKKKRKIGREGTPPKVPSPIPWCPARAATMDPARWWRLSCHSEHRKWATWCAGDRVESAFGNRDQDGVRMRRPGHWQLPSWVLLMSWRAWHPNRT